MGISGSVKHNFKKTGIISYSQTVDDFESFFEFCANQNVDDIQENDDTYDVITTLESFHNVMVYLEDKYSLPKLSAIEWRPINTIEVNDEENAKKLLILLDKLEDLDDVQTVASNFSIDEELLKKVIQ